MTPSINGYIEPSERTASEPSFSVKFSLLVLCLAVLALAAWLQAP